MTVAGFITRAPERRKALSGNDFLTLKIVVEDDTAGRIFWAVNVFRRDVTAQLEGLTVGDFIAVRGRLRAEIWWPSNGGDPRINLTCSADRVEHVAREAERYAGPQNDDKSQPSLPLADQRGVPF